MWQKSLVIDRQGPGNVLLEACLVFNVLLTGNEINRLVGPARNQSSRLLGLWGPKEPQSVQNDNCLSQWKSAILLSRRYQKLHSVPQRAFPLGREKAVMGVARALTKLNLKPRQTIRLEPSSPCTTSIFCSAWAASSFPRTPANGALLSLVMECFRCFRKTQGSHPTTLNVLLCRTATLEHMAVMPPLAGSHSNSMLGESKRKARTSWKTCINPRTIPC